MDVRVLGPIELVVVGQRVDLPRRATRLILGILALEANRVVPLVRLIDLLWPEQPPESARDLLYRRVSELRTSLAAGSSTSPAEIATGHGGYLLRTDPNVIDAHRFTRLADEARGQPDQGARLTLRAALGLWRGAVLDGWLRDQGSGVGHSLEAARLAALEDLFDIELRLGRHAVIVSEILDAVDGGQPASERLMGQPMLALFRSKVNGAAPAKGKTPTSRFSPRSPTRPRIDGDLFLHGVR